MFMRAATLTVCLGHFVASAAPPTFDIDAGSAREQQRFADFRCGTGARRVTDGGTQYWCPKNEGVDVTDTLRLAMVVLRGRIESISLARNDAELGPVQRAKVRVRRVLKGEVTEPTVSFLFAPKFESNRQVRAPAVGEDGLFVLAKGTGQQDELELFSTLSQHFDSRGMTALPMLYCQLEPVEICGASVLASLDRLPPQAELYLASLMPSLTCPDEPRGTCDVAGWQCMSATTACECSRPQQGGLHIANLERQPSRWTCRPRACLAATRGGACEPVGLSCPGPWGATQWACGADGWQYYEVSPPP